MARITKKEVLKAVKGSSGLVTAIAKRMACSRKHFYTLMKKWPEVAEAVEDEREGMKDFTEGQLMKNIRDGKEASIFFYLKTQCKDRGYVERQEWTGKDGGPMEHKMTLADRLKDVGKEK